MPAFTDFSLANPSKDIFEAVAVLPVGARAMLEGGEPFGRRGACERAERGAH